MQNKAPANWEEKTLGELCNIAIGKTPSRSNAKYWDKDLTTNNTWLSIADLSNTIDKKVYSSKERLSDIGAKEVKIVKQGTLLLSFKLTLGRVAFAGKDLRTNEAIAQLPVKDSSVILKSFLYYYLQYFDYETLLNGDVKVKGKALNKNKLQVLSVVYPKQISEQERIVRILDEVFENIEKAKQNTLKNLNNAKELFEAFLMQIFSNSNHWERKKLEDVAIDFGRGRSRHRPRNDKKLYGGKYPFIQTGDVRNSNHFITEYSQTYNDEGLAQSKLWPKGTLCITIAANIAETGILTFDACFPDSVIGCVFDNNETNIYYVEYLLQSFKSILQAEGKGSAQDNINLGTFEKYSFPFPEKETQDSIVKKLDNMREFISNLEQTYNQKLKSLEELKQSILQKAFNGEL